jgi:hypothetical protein
MVWKVHWQQWGEKGSNFLQKSKNTDYCSISAIPPMRHNAASSNRIHPIDARQN